MVRISLGSEGIQISKRKGEDPDGRGKKKKIDEWGVVEREVVTT